MIKLNYIYTMNFTFENVQVLNCKNTKDFENKIMKNKPILINNEGIIEGINSSYIMYWS